MTAEREKAINEWLDIHCRMCANNDDRGTDFLNCQAECEVQKDVGIACIHYDAINEAVGKATANPDVTKNENRKNTNNWRKMHGLPMKRKQKAREKHERGKRADSH